MASTELWNITSGTELTTLIERTSVNIALPVANGIDGIEIELIAGELPVGTRIEGTSIVGTAYEVQRDTLFTGTFRAHWQGNFDDRTIKIIVTGPDEPSWITPEGLLSIGNNNTYFILDNELIDFQLLATDPDLPAGDELDFFIADGDGSLPPGIILTEDGRLYGVTEPLLSLDKRYRDGGYDTMPYGDLPIDYAVYSGNGFSSFYYDTVGYGYFEETTSLKKLNRYYPFSVTVSDGETFIKRDFKIYVVGDDFLRADNTTMSASTGVFTADTTHLRTPTWVTPRDLGYRRANNFQTIYLDIIDNSTLTGTVVYTLDDVNDNGTVSTLPPGLSLDSITGEVTGIIPYQPAITQDYTFTVRATRFEGDLETVTIYGTFYEDTLLGVNNFKVGKLDLTGDIDEVADLKDLIARKILINNREYTVVNVDSRNDDYDLIFVDDTIGPKIPLVLSRKADIGQDYIFVNRLTEDEKLKYQGRTLNFSKTSVPDSYVIQDIIPYIEYEITQTNPTEDPILPVGSPRSLEAFENFYVGEYAIYSTEVGGDGNIYVCTSAHSVLPQYDPVTELGITVDDILQVDFQSSNWTVVAPTLADMPQETRITATKQALEAKFGGVVYIDVVQNNRWRIKLRSTATSRIIANIREMFINSGDSTELLVKVLRDNEDRISFDVNLSRSLNSGRNIGIALFRKDYFSKNIPIASTDETVLPSKAKTFEIKILGEIDSSIKWLTDADLGSINANFTSTLRVQAETTVPDTAMVYRIIDGKLPNGMRLNYAGEIIGAANQYPQDSILGLTTFDNQTVSWDGSLPGDTTFDRVYKFTVEAKDRFGYTAIEREFSLKIEDLDNTQYTDIYVKPMLKPEQRDLYTIFLSQPEVFTPASIYRPDDPKFGIQTQIKMLMYAGIEAKDIGEFVAATAKNHKRKSYVLGEIKKAIAIDTNNHEVIYEVIYVDVIDIANPKNKKTNKSFTIKTSNNITVDSNQYAAKDDVTKEGYGYPGLAVSTRNSIKILYATQDSIEILARDSDYNLNTDNNDFIVTLSEGGGATVNLTLTDSEPYKIRPNTNTIKVDSNAIKVSQSKDNVRYISNTENMRSNIKAIGKNERNYLPLWMRSPQEGFQELDYITAVPICYCKPGTADDILLNIKNTGFKFNDIHFDIDRYIVERSDGVNDEQYVLFANYQFNV